MRKILAVLGVVVICSAAVRAEFWDDKAFTAWSDMELQRILADSPWSRRAEVVDSAAAAGRGDNAARGGGGRGGRGGRGGPAQFNLTVTWRSALPMKQALIRSQIGQNKPVPADAQEVLDRREEAYAISVTGLPMAAAQVMEGVKDMTQLVRAGKAPVMPEQLLTAPQPDGTLLMLAVFPRSAMIAVEDTEVEFTTQIANLTVKRKFTLKDMVFKGQLEL